MEEQIKTLIDQIRPAIQMHGGDVEYIAMEGTVVKLKLHGACHACPHAMMTLHEGIETQLKEQVNPGLTVERVL